MLTNLPSFRHTGRRSQGCFVNEAHGSYWFAGGVLCRFLPVQAKCCRFDFHVHDSVRPKRESADLHFDSMIGVCPFVRCVVVPASVTRETDVG